MVPLTLRDMQIFIAAALFIMGCLCILLGAFVLITRGYSREIRTLAVNTARLGQKGMAQEVAGLVTSASELVSSINQLVRTASGVGVFLVSLGLVMIGASYWMILQIQWTL